MSATSTPATHINPAEFIRNHTTTVITSVITTLGLILGAAVAVENRYAHADTFKKSEAETSGFLKQQTLEIRRQSQMLRRSLIEDRLFELDTKRDIAGNALPTLDEAQYKRYTRQIQEIDAVIASLGQVQK